MLRFGDVWNTTSLVSLGVTARAGGFWGQRTFGPKSGKKGEIPGRVFSQIVGNHNLMKTEMNTATPGCLVLV